MQLILDSRYSNLEQFLQEVDHWDLDFRLLDTGGFQGHLKQLVSRDVLISYARIQRGLDQAGSTPAGYRTFVILGKGCNGFWWRGHQVTNNDLLVFPESNELRCASAADFEIFTVSVRTAFLNQLDEDLGLSGLVNRKREVIRLETHTAQGLRSIAGMIVRSTGGAVMQAASQGLAEKLAIYTARDHSEIRPSLRKRDLAVDRIVEYVRSTSVPASKLDVLCHIAGTSERTLQYAFKDRYGISPYAYVKRWRLNQARRLLLQANPEDATVNDIAMSLDFFHQGQFATDYRKLFSESPSATLKWTPSLTQ